MCLYLYIVECRPGRACAYAQSCHCTHSSVINGLKDFFYYYYYFSLPLAGQRDVYSTQRPAGTGAIMRACADSPWSSLFAGTICGKLKVVCLQITIMERYLMAWDETVRQRRRLHCLIKRISEHFSLFFNLRNPLGRIIILICINVIILSSGSVARGKHALMCSPDTAPIVLS